jgi:hypothetical protein
MAELEKNVDSALEGLDEQRRETLKRLIRGGAFVGPVVASFAMQGISIRPAHAASSSISNFSDIRLKRDVVRLGTHTNGCGIYSFRYLWSNTKYIGAIAQDVLEHDRDAVIVAPGGFLAVDYEALGMTMCPEAEHAY